MKKQSYLLPAIIAGIVILGGLFLWIWKEQSFPSPMPIETSYEGSIQVTAPTETIDEETGEVDQAAFEQNQKLSDDTSLETIEAELNNTVILEEDFSDL